MIGTSSGTPGLSIMAAIEAPSKIKTMKEKVGLISFLIIFITLMVRVAGFEPATPRSQSVCATSAPHSDMLIIRHPPLVCQAADVSVPSLAMPSSAAPVRALPSPAKRMLLYHRTNRKSRLHVRMQCQVPYRRFVVVLLDSAQ